MVWDRCVHRQFMPDEIPNEDLQTMLSLAAQAPSGFNLQPWRFVVVQRPEQRKRLCEAAHGQSAMADAPVIVAAYGRREGWMEHAAEIFGDVAGASEGDERAADPAEVAAFDFVHDQRIAVWLTRNVMVAFTYLMVAAEALGWDTAPMEDFDAAAVCAALHLPADAEVVALLAIGRIRDSAGLPSRRLPLEKLVCAERDGVSWGDPIRERI